MENLKSTARANSNLALIKYWGKKDPKLFIPMNPNISFTLEGIYTTTTVEFSDSLEEDEVTIDGKEMEGGKKEKAVKHLNLIRKIAGKDLKAKVVSENNFPIAAGLASSASGFAALTVAATSALGLNLDEKQLSIISRQGSGSSSRSITGGFIEWKIGNTSEESYVEQIAPKDHWDLRDVIAIVAREEKKVSSRAGMAETVKNCPLYQARLEAINEYFPKMKKAILEKNFKTLGELTEHEALSMHACMMTTKPMILYWTPETIRVIKKIVEWREEGIQAYFTMDAGPNVHVITLSEQAEEVEKRLKEIEGVEKVYHCRVGDGARILEEHLF